MGESRGTCGRRSRRCVLPVTIQWLRECGTMCVYAQGEWSQRERASANDFQYQLILSILRSWFFYEIFGKCVNNRVWCRICNLSDVVYVYHYHTQFMVVVLVHQLNKYSSDGLIRERERDTYWWADCCLQIALIIHIAWQTIYLADCVWQMMTVYIYYI